MTIWLDNQLPPALTMWVRATLGVECTSVRDLALQRAADLEIFQAALAVEDGWTARAVPLKPASTLDPTVALKAESFRSGAAPAPRPSSGTTGRNSLKGFRRRARSDK